MKIHVKINGDVRLVIQYEADEWTRVEAKLRELGLDKQATTNAWGIGESAAFYRETSGQLIEAMRSSVESVRSSYYRLVDAINQAFLSPDSRFLNIAVFRIVPSLSGEVSVPVQKYLTLLEVKNIVAALSKVYEFLLNTATERDEFTVVKREGASDD